MSDYPYNQVTELTVTLEVTDTRTALAWLEQVILEQGHEHGITAILDTD